MKGLERVDRVWTRLEVALCVGVVVTLVVALLGWVTLKGLASRTTDEFVAGLVFRALAGGLLVGALVRRVAPRWAGVGMAVGAALAWPVRDVGVDLASNALGWLQDGSLLTWLGGLRGVATRLTLWLALLGASLATASGRHVTIDVLTRGLTESARPWLARLSGLFAALVCVGAAWGFFDFVAIDAFHAPSSGGVEVKVSSVSQGLRRHASRAWVQLGVDARVAGRVLRAQRWDTCVTGAEWNTWVGDRFPELREPDESSARGPLVSLPDEASRGLLVKDFDLLVPFGLVMIALRSLLWVLRGAPSQGSHA